MNQAVLVSPRTEAGKKIIELLDKTKLEVHSAFWLFVPELREWRLIIASPMVTSKGAREVYRIIRSVLPQTPESERLSLRDIPVTPPSDPLVQLLRVPVRTRPGISGIRFTGNTINNVVIEDAYIYRVQ